MAAAPIYTIQPSANEYLDPQGYYRPPSPTISLSPTLVNNTHHTERPSLKLTIPSGASNILNSLVVDPTGQSVYSILSDSKRTILFSCRDNAEIATIQWDRSSPTVVYRRKKFKCRKWLPLTGPENEYMPIHH
jgi:hypothetical protein